MRWFRLILALAAAAWLAHAAFRFLGSPFPDYGMWISVPMDGSVQFEKGTLKTGTGGIHAIDFSPWWLPSMAVSIALLLALAVRGSLVRGAGRS